jgi:hypothetical protein
VTSFSRGVSIFIYGLPELPIDDASERIVELRVVAHPSVSDAQQRLIRLEYFGDAERPPRYLLAVSNRKAIEKWLFSEQHF